VDDFRLRTKALPGSAVPVEASFGPAMHVFPSPFGTVGILWTRSGRQPSVLRVFLSAPGSDARSRCLQACPSCLQNSCREVSDLAAIMTAFLEGSPVTVPVDMARMEDCTAFQRSVLMTESYIPRGRFSTYAVLAAAVGRPGAARAVGSALARNPFPILVPCHRTLCSNGSLGGYQGGTGMKKRLLAMEGAVFSPPGKLPGRPFLFTGGPVF
jgi:methylated-DNA-[protein]-cysteine S-methyltransferase